MKKSLICIILMMTVAPIVVCATLVCLDPLRWGGTINPIAIIGMAMFGLISTPLWPTYIPSLIITPLLMKGMVRSHVFRTISLRVLISISLIVGAIAGALVMVRVILMSLNEPRLAMQWAIAGTLAGSVTFSLIVLVYRRL